MMNMELRCVYLSNNWQEGTFRYSVRLQEVVDPIVTASQPSPMSNQAVAAGAYRNTWEYDITAEEYAKFEVGATYHMNVTERVTAESRNSLLSHVTDIIKRSGVERADELIRDLEKRLN